MGSRFVNATRGLSRLAAIACLLLATAAHAESAAFSIDGERYPRWQFDLKVHSRLASVGRNVQALRHPAALRKYQREVLDRLIEEHLLAAQAQRTGITVNEAALARALQDSPPPGMTPAAWRAELTRDLLINGWLQRLAREIAIDDAAIDRAMAASTRPILPQRALARHILLGATQQGAAVAPERLAAHALDLMAQLQGGAKFADLARTHSSDKSAPNGGDLGWITRGQMVPAFEQAVFEAPLDTVIGPVATPYGLHLILVQAREDETPMTDAQWRQRARARLAADEMAARVRDTLASLRSSAKLDVYISLP